MKILYDLPGAGAAQYSVIATEWISEAVGDATVTVEDATVTVEDATEAVEDATDAVGDATEAVGVFFTWDKENRVKILNSLKVLQKRAEEGALAARTGWPNNELSKAIRGHNFIKSRPFLPNSDGGYYEHYFFT